MGRAAAATAPALIPDLEVEAEPRQTGGVTTRLILDYVAREGGTEAVTELLERSGTAGREAELRDENNWCSYATKIALLEAAAEVLDDPLAARHIGAAGMDFNVAPGIKMSLRALGSLGVLYRNVARTASKFTTTHRMEALEVGSRHARIAYTDTSGTGYHPADCELNIGFLSCGPLVFGMPLARVSHPVCARDGGDACIYEIRWEAGASRVRRAMVAGTASVAALAGAALAAPALLPAAGVAAAAALGFELRAELAFRRRRLKSLEHHADRAAEATERLAVSLQDLVSELRLDEVLEKIVKHAQNAVGGKEFVLLVDDGDGMRCRSASILPATSIEALEAWAEGSQRLEESATVIDDLSLVPVLRGLAEERSLPLGSLCAAPLLYRGRSLGAIVALANGAGGFLPHDVELLQSYAAQAAIALTNARLFETQEQLAARDPLTGLFNHREFQETVTRELDTCRRHGGQLSVVLLDLDRFKQVNDTAGHAAGDRVLVAAADVLRDSCRGADLPFRIGGDEFALVLPRTGARLAALVGERVAQAVNTAEPRVSVSFGVGEWPADGPTKDGVLSAADERLYAMKRMGSSRAANRSDESGDRRRDHLACAGRLSARLLRLASSDEIAQTTVDELHATFHYHLAVIHRTDPDGVLRPVAGAGPLVSEMSVVTDARRNSGSELSVPVRVNGSLWGVLNLEHVENGAFDADDIVFANLVAAHLGAALDRARLRGELEGTLMTTLAALCDALEQKDRYTAAHAHDVADLSEAVGARLGIVGDELRNLRYAALLHDIGKIGIRTEILTKPGKLSAEEFAEIKQHTLIGQRMLERIPFFEGVHRLVRWAHERWDGAGYPDGLAGTDIPRGARIICACDAFHAMTSTRPYRSAMGADAALEELRRCAGTHFDPEVVDALVEEAVAAGRQG